MRSPLRGIVAGLLFSALLFTAAHSYGSDLSPVASSDDELPGAVNQVHDEVLSFSEKSDDTQDLGHDVDNLQSKGESGSESEEKVHSSQSGNTVSKPARIDSITEFESTESLSQPEHKSVENSEKTSEKGGAPSTPAKHESSSAEDEDDEVEDFSAVEHIVRVGENAVANDKNSTRGLTYFRLAGALGHSGALATAASMLLSGDNGVPRDVAGAVRLLRLAADAGQPDAQAFLGILYATGLADRHGVEKNAAKSIVHWNFAAEMGSVYAATALGYRHMFGIDVPADCASAANYYRRAAKAIATDPANWPSARNFMLGLPPLPPELRIYERSRLKEEVVNGLPERPAGDEDVLHYYRHSAGRGNVEALTILGALHLFGGEGYRRDERRAALVFNRAANAGNGDAHAILAHMEMLKKEKGAKDVILAHFQESAKLGNKNGHYGLGMIYLHGLYGQEKNYKLAFLHFNEAVEGQHAAAAFQVGTMYWRGRGVDASQAQAYRFFQHGARLGNMQSEFQLATILLQGLPPVGKPDCRAALRHFKSVAEKSEWKTIFKAASNAFDSGDDFGALYRFMQAAHAGIELGQFNAGLLLEKRPSGIISEIGHWDRSRLIDEATELYQLSAQQGHSESLVRAGNLAFIEKKDYTSAVAAYKGGTLLKNAEAMFSLGWMYVRGLGVPQDRELALRYLNLAKSSKAEALLPATVAVVFLRVYWYIRDVAHSLGVDTYLEDQYQQLRVATGSWLMEVQIALQSSSYFETFLSGMAAGNKWSSQEAVQDVVIFGFLLLALTGVMILRSWKIYSVERQLDADPHEE